MENQSELDAARGAYIAALQALNEANQRGLQHERLYNLRVTLNQAVEMFEAQYGTEVVLQLQLSFLQSLPMFLNSGKTQWDAVALVDTVIAPLGLKVQKEAAFPVTAGGVVVGGRPNAMLAISDVAAAAAAFGAESPGQASASIGVPQDGGQVLEARTRKKRRSGHWTEEMNAEILALFFKFVREGISLKNLSETVAIKFSAAHGLVEDDMMTGQRINRWWYRNFKLEGFHSLGDLKYTYELSDAHFETMKKYYDGWKATHENMKAKRSSEGNVEVGIPAGLVANVDKITDEEEGDGESLPPSLGIMMHVDSEKTESTTTTAATISAASTFAVSTCSANPTSSTSTSSANPTFCASTSAAPTSAAPTSSAPASAAPTSAVSTSKSLELVPSSRATSEVSDGLDDSLVDADVGETPKTKKMKSDRIKSKKRKRRHGHHRSHRSHRNDTGSSREAKGEDSAGSMVDDIDDAEKEQEKQRQDEQ